jgi:hypothetical protein
MKGKLTKITGIYTLLDDNDRMVASDDVDMQKDYQIGKLSTKNCNGIFGLYDVEGLADFYSTMTAFFKKGEVPTHKEIEDAEYISKISFKAGFNKAMELNKDKAFTEFDIISAFEYGWNQRHFGKTDEDELRGIQKRFIQSLQQPTEIEVGIEMENKEYILTQNGEGFEDQSYRTWETAPKIDSEGFLILKKI